MYSLLFWTTSNKWIIKSQLYWSGWWLSKYTVACLQHISWLGVAFAEDIDLLQSNSSSGPRKGRVQSITTAPLMCCGPRKCPQRKCFCIDLLQPALYVRSLPLIMISEDNSMIFLYLYSEQAGHKMEKVHHRSLPDDFFFMSLAYSAHTNNVSVMQKCVCCNLSIWEKVNGTQSGSVTFRCCTSSVDWP